MMVPRPGISLSALAPSRANTLPASAETQALPSDSLKRTPWSPASCRSMSSCTAVTATMSRTGSGTRPAPMDQRTCSLMMRSARSFTHDSVAEAEAPSTPPLRDLRPPQSRGEPERAAPEIVRLARGRERLRARQLRERARVKPLLRQDPLEHGAHVGGRLGIGRDGLDALEPHALRVRAHRATRLQIANAA